MNKHLTVFLVLLCSLLLMPAAWAAPDIEIDTPAIAAIKAEMKDRHQQLKPHYESGAIGLTRDGLIAVRDATVLPLSQRQSVNALVAEQNKERSALYKEIATANGHPEWEPQVRSTFAERWASKAKPGWWYQDASGAWVKK